MIKRYDACKHRRPSRMRKFKASWAVFSAADEFLQRNMATGRVVRLRVTRPEAW